MKEVMRVKKIPRKHNHAVTHIVFAGHIVPQRLHKTRLNITSVDSYVAAATHLHSIFSRYY